MISASAKIHHQEVMENYLRSGRSQGKVRENESQKKWPPCALLLDLHAQEIQRSHSQEKTSFIFIFVVQSDRYFRSTYGLL